MKLSELQSANLPCGLYVVEGDDSYLRNQAIEVFRSLVDKDVADLNLSEFDGGVSGNVLTNAIEALPFMADRRVVIVRDWEVRADDGAVKAVLASVKRADSTVAVFVSDTRALPTLLKKAATVVRCDKPDVFLLADRISAKFAAASVRASDGVCKMIATYSGLDTGRALNEADKLVSTGLKLITENEVKTYVHRETDYAIFALTDEIAAGNRAMALEILRDLSVENSPASILAVLQNNYRRVLYVALSKESDEALIEALGVHPYVLKKTRALAKNYSQVGIKKLVDKLTELETDFKTGKLSEENAMWLAIFNVFHA